MLTAVLKAVKMLLSCCPENSQDADVLAALKAVKMLLSCCPKNSQDDAVLAALKAVQDAEKNHSAHKDQVQRLIPISDLRAWMPKHWHALKTMQDSFLIKK
jgi:hypothetical protein